MRHRPVKQSIFDIQPWNEQPSQIPHEFLTMNQFAKTSNNQKSTFKKTKNLQIATNSVYFIKHHQEETPFSMQAINRYPRTTQNSPKFNNNPTEQSSSSILNKNRVIRPVCSSSKLFKRRQKIPNIHTPFQHTKKIIFDVKTSCQKSNYQKRQITDEKQEKDALNKNLLRIYERSTVANDQKKIAKLEKQQIDSICIRRKLKTEKDNLSENVKISSNIYPKNIVQLDKDSNQTSKHYLTKGLSFDRLKYVNTQTSQKMKIQLFLQRKLYMMKNQQSKLKKSRSKYSPLSPDKKK